MQSSYEVVVIGGGIHGAGVAQACAAAGYKTLIIEKDDWAAGTSSKSSKLIHGGLRYLESGQLSLVWQSLKEREILLSIAPDLVKPLEFVIPIYEDTQRHPWQLHIGLSIYSLLSGFSSLSKYTSSKKIGTTSHLKQDNLKTLFSYFDAQTDDRKLTKAVIDSAKAIGATTICPAELISALRSDNGYQLEISTQSENISIGCDYLINTAGPWANNVCKKIDPAIKTLPIELVKGSHLILQGQLSEKAFYLESPTDGRAIFALPWHDNTLIGTTEEIFNGDIENIQISEKEKDYLLNIYSHYFPNLKPVVIDTFAGVRVLPISNDSPFSRPRECIFHQDKHHPHLLTLYGGKLTGYRHTALQVTYYVKRAIGDRPRIADTSKLALTSS